ncbi:ankyrin repeat domain-containing protein [Flavobacterium sp. WV_118_3]|uniref:ankyrin repeat domain-containing protein n=1 Tax=Flavobacterium sp. WV_118_3 TaxID=3151764 RepID=UPI00321B6BBE
MEKMTLKEAQSILKKHNLEAEGKHLFDAFGNIKLFEALLVAGADANHFNTYFNVPILSLAYSRQEYTNFRLLLEYGANPDTPSSVFENREPIIFEIASPQKGVDGFLYLMIKAGIDLNQMHPESGYTLLQHAASRYFVSLENLEHLIAKGADPNLPNRDGQTLYDLIDNGKINLRKWVLLALKKHQTGYVERPVEFQLVAPPQKPEWATHFYYPRGSFRIVKVLDKTEDTLTVRMYRTQQHDIDFPRTHTDALVIIFSLLEHSNTPSVWKDAVSVFYFENDHAALARDYIQSHIVSDFDLTFRPDLWKEKGYKTLEETSEEEREQLQQATMTITVKEPEMLRTIEVGSWCKVPEFNVAPLWYLENKATSQYYFFYISNGGRWIAKEGEIGTEAKGKVIGGIASGGYYKEEYIRAEAFVSKKFEEGFELVYKNFDTAYNLEEGIEKSMREVKNNENKNQEYSEAAFEAFANKDVTKLAEILGKGIHPDTLKDNHGNTALEDVGGALYLEPIHFEMFKLLLDSGANPNVANYDVPLIHKIALHAKDEIADEMVRCLVEAGADTQVISKRGAQSTLQCACRGGMLWFVEHLLENGADPNYKDEDEARTALHYALDASRNAAAIIDLLLQYGADKNSLYTFYRRENAFELADTIEAVQKLVDLGFDINMPTQHSDYPAILTVARRGSVKMFDAFLKLGGMDEMHRILSSLCEPLDRNSQSKIKEQIEKMRLLHKLGYSLISVTDNNPIENLVDRNLKKRKKIAKWEEQALLDLWEMDCAPRRLHKLNELNEYLTKVNSKPMMEKCQQRITEIQAALN